VGGDHHPGAAHPAALMREMPVFIAPERAKTVFSRGAMCYVSPRNATRGMPRTHQNQENHQMAKKAGPPTKSEILNQIAKDTGLSRKAVNSVFESLNGVMKKSLRANSLFTLPGVAKFKVVKKPATKAREGVNPFTGEKMVFKAKPASKKIRAMALKNLKNMVN
jgi:DNA-binding protein HU-beta